jgi:hypothetical protein
VTTVVATLGETLASAPSTSSTEWNCRPLPPRGDRVVFPLGICHLLAHRSGASPLELAEHAEHAQVLELHELSPVEALGVVLPVRLGEVCPRLRLVGRAGTASPCRPGMHLGAW